jgi:exodeoxyribonuclease VII small subunit
MSPKKKTQLSTTPVHELNFEQAFEELEKIVRQLDDGQLSLDESLTLFERGQALAAHCGGLLDNAELKVRKLIPKEDGYVLEDFDEIET